VDWVAISQVATAGGTLVLAIATFSSVKAGRRSTELAERSLLAAQRPLLMPSLESDEAERVRFGDGHVITIVGHAGVLEQDDDNGNLYMAMSVRNGGAGFAVIHGWRVSTDRATPGAPQPDVAQFRAQTRDLYVPAGGTGFWQGAIRDRDDVDYAPVAEAVRGQDRVMVDLLYGDADGGQRTITRFSVSTPSDPGGPRAEVLRVWRVDGQDPRPT
jgi:hypothetical protein